MPNKTVVTRIAPSPTGFAHIGTVRTALFNWLHAKKHGGEFFIRIEDTDQVRFTPGAADHLLAALRRVGLDWNAGPDIGGPAGPYVQSLRLPIYHEHAERLLAAGHLYKCWCSQERLKDLNADHEANGSSLRGYNGHCRHLSADERAAKESSSAPFVLRLAAPTEGETVVHDLVLADTVFLNETIGDRVMIKSDGYPVYHFASVVDDHHMGVTHVMRGGEWLASTPIHLMLYGMFGWEPPQFAHLGLVLNNKGVKLAKRNGDASVEHYVDELGFEPEALLNILALTGLGYPDGVEELKTVAQMIEQFDIARLTKMDTMLDLGKLAYFNGAHLRRMTIGEFTKRLIPHLVKAGYVDVEPTAAQMALVDAVVPILQPRLEVPLMKAPEAMSQFFEEPVAERTKLLGKNGTVETIDASLVAAHETLSALIPFDVTSIGACLKDTAAQKGLKKELLMAARVAITGKEKSLPLFETIEILGREKTLARLALARKQLG